MQNTDMATKTNKLPWYVQEQLSEALHEIDHIQNTRAMVSSILEEIEEWHYKGDTQVVFELNRQSLDTLLHMQHKMIKELTTTLQELRQYEPGSDTTGKAEGWESRGIPSIDIDAMDKTRAHKQKACGEQGQQK